MKYFFLCLLGSSLLYACTSNDTKTAGSEHSDSVNHEAKKNAAYDSANYTSIQWLDSVHQDLGKVKEGSVLEISWRFKNTGTKPLIISNASASCGCTVAEKPEEPIAPGAESIIKAKFDSKDRVGMQNKEVYVLANTNGSNNHQLSFTVEVEKK